jgi:hypothetical protein
MSGWRGTWLAYGHIWTNMPAAWLPLARQWNWGMAVFLA